MSIEELCAKYRNEEPHSRHVAALALKLFDSTHVLFGVPADRRSILEAACRLHDLGYGSDPRGHARTGSEIILEEAPAGYGTVQRQKIAALVRTHSSRTPIDVARALFRTMDDPPGLLHLAALLRIADALDYGHLQDAEITSVREMKRKVRVNVSSEHAPGGIDAARAQAARWREAFPVDLDIRQVGHSGRPRPLLGPFLPAHEAIRRLMFMHYRVVQLNAEEAAGPSGTEALHDLRIAVRRLRALLRAFDELLDGTSAERINLDLQRLNRTLGTARDLDVWIGFCSMGPVSQQFTGHRLWGAFVAHQLEHRRLQQATVRRQLQGPSFHALSHRIGHFLRIELPAAASLGPAEPLETLARKAIARALKRVMKLGHLRNSQSPEKLHRLRRALRKLRYLAGFFDAVLGPVVRKLGKRSHAMERMLGEMRDAELALHRIENEGPSPPRQLIRQLDRMRTADAVAVEQAWTRLKSPAFLALVRQTLTN